MTAIAAKLSQQEMSAVSNYIAALRPGDRPSIPHSAQAAGAPRTFEGFVPPSEQSMPSEGAMGRMLVLGQRVFDDTPSFAAEYVGNRMSCRNCHLARGRDAYTSPLWAAVSQYPKYRRKNDRVNTMAMRIQGCFTYSENGLAPPADSDVMVALLAYAHWLARGMPIGVQSKASGYPPIEAPERPPSRERGRRIFDAQCALCHGHDGQGRAVANEVLFPPLWGPQSYNWGAGMHRVETAAQFIKVAMPLGLGGSLGNQDAWDVAAFINSHPRPQDPRFAGSTEATRARYHASHRYGFYGETIDGQRLGAARGP